MRRGARGFRLVGETGEVVNEVGDKVTRVVGGAVDEAGFASAEDRKSDDIEARGVDDTSIVTKTTFPVEDRNVKPVIVGTETSGPYNRTDLAAGEIELETRLCGHARGFESLRGKVSALACLGGPGVKRIEKAIHLEIGERELISKSAGKERTAVPNRRPATHQADSAISQDIEVEAGALWCTDQLGRRELAGAVDVVDLVVTFVPYSAGVHPPEAVAPAVASGQSHMLANGERHLSPGVLDFVR